MELILEIDVSIGLPYSVEGANQTICMLPFTAQAHGRYFNGASIGQCVDTQRIASDGRAVLSARYMLQGMDCDGKLCKLFIENNGTMEDGFKPSVVTDSIALRSWETEALSAVASPTQEGVLVRLYKE